MGSIERLIYICVYKYASLYKYTGIQVYLIITHPENILKGNNLFCNLSHGVCYFYQKISDFVKFLINKKLTFNLL